jgi:hypothetical protein
MNKKFDELIPMRNDDLLIAELDDRFEMAVAVQDTNYGCNGTGCTQNGYCPKTT